MRSEYFEFCECTVVVWQLLFVIFSLMSQINGSQELQPPREEISRYRKDGDIIIGIVDTFRSIIDSTERHCESFDIYAYNIALSMMFALQEINKNDMILKNITLGYECFDSCGDILRNIESVFWFLSGGKTSIPNYNCHAKASGVALITGWFSEITVDTARVLGLQRIPQVSYGCQDLSLSDHYQFPSFLRTIPSSADVLDGVVHLLQHFQWTWVGILVSPNYAAQESSLILKNKLINAGICIELYEFIPVSTDKQHLIKVIKMSSSKILIASSSYGLLNLLYNLAKQNITDKTWIGLDPWPQSASFIDTSLQDLICGALWFIVTGDILPGFMNFKYSLHPLNDVHDVFSFMFWETFLKCRISSLNASQATQNQELPVCSGNESLRDAEDEFGFFSDSPGVFGYLTYIAVYATAYGLQDMQRCIPGEGPFLNGSCAAFPHFHPWQLFHYLRNVHFEIPGNVEFYFNDEGYLQSPYSIRNWQIKQGGYVDFVKVGSYNPSALNDKGLTISSDKIMWNGQQRQAPWSVCSETCPSGFRMIAQRGRPVCCFDCIWCPEGEISNQSGSKDCHSCPKDKWPNPRKDKCIQRSIEFLSFYDALGASLTAAATVSFILVACIFVTFVNFHDTPLVKANNRNLSYILLVALMLCSLCPLMFIGYPTVATCRFRQPVFGITFVLSVSCVLMKTIMVVIAFKASKPGSTLLTWVGPQLIYTAIGLCTFIQLIICITWIIVSPPSPELNYEVQPGVIVVECNEGSATAFWLMLGYLGILAGVCFIVAFLSRKLPDSFNEALHITFSMVVFISVWLVFIPAYYSTKGKYMVAVEVFAIISSVAGLVGCIFFPKCFIILIRPNMNTKQYIMSRGSRGE